MKPLTEREVIVLARQCAMRVCSTEEHHGCPYGDEGMVDCVERLEKDYEEAIDRLLLIAEGIHRGTIQEVGADGSVKATGETSDGYHTFNELYRHRTELFAALCNLFPGRAWKSTKHFDGTMEKGWFIAGIDTPDGQATYHCRGDFWNLFRVRELETAPKWDGHTPEDVLRRIQELVHTEAAYVENWSGGGRRLRDTFRTAAPTADTRSRTEAVSCCRMETSSASTTPTGLTGTTANTGICSSQRDKGGDENVRT